jgi:cardiolipin synthase
VNKKLLPLILIAPLILTLFLGFPQESNQISSIGINFDDTYTGTMNVTCYSSPDSTFDILTSHMEAAQEEIDIMIYAISHYDLVKLLNDTMDRDPTIKINIIACEQHATGGETSYTNDALWQLSGKANDTGADVNLYWSSTTFDFTHAKFVIIDNETLLVQSANFAKTGVPEKTSYGNREWGIAINDPDVVNHFLDVFYLDLLIAEPTHGQDTSAIWSSSSSSGSYPQNFPAQQFNEYMKITPVFSPDNSLSSIVELINLANETLEIQQAYIYYEWNSTVPESPIVEAIVNAHNRGVDVRIIVEEPSSTKANDTVNYLTQQGISVAISNSTYFQYCHNKGAIVDSKLVLISSINWGDNSVLNNREAAVIVENENVAEFYLEIFNYDWSVAEQMDPASDIPIEYLIIGGVIGAILVAIIGIFTKKSKK